MLALDGQAAGLIEEAIQGSAALFDGEHLGFQEGERIGVYRVIREIGRGGMGTVYLAERDDEQFKKHVAIKLVTRGMDTDALLRRFRHERQILARLDHPYIAGLLDGGSTADGRPYLVMEYVEGKRHHRLLRRRTSWDRARASSCSARSAPRCNTRIRIWWSTAISSPATSWSTADGIPKLLDFGIAKLLGPGRRCRSSRSRPGRHAHADPGLRQSGTGARRAQSPPPPTSTRWAPSSTNCWPACAPIA